MRDHVHMLFGFRPNQSLADLMQQVTQDSSSWINKKRFLKDRFSWQAGYGAFSYSESQVPKVIQYIQNQEHHHKKVTFTEEYVKLLEKYEIDSNQCYLFKPI